MRSPSHNDKLFILLYDLLWLVPLIRALQPKGLESSTLVRSRQLLDELNDVHEIPF